MGKVILGLDPATRRFGYCVGDGSRVPIAGAWRLTADAEDLGEMGHEVRGNLNRAIDVYGVGLIVYEAPLMVPKRDNLATLRRLYCLGGFIELVARDRGCECYEVKVGEVKKELAGTGGAKKPDMMAAAEKVGVRLPPGKDAEDAADSFGAWLVGVRLFAKEYAAEWDRRLWSSRGKLL
jgi:Holliday junction resolvasome RuvABC endonuclease subunit